MTDNEVFPAALVAFRNTPRADGVSPAQLMMGRRLNIGLPVLEESLLPSPYQLAAHEQKKAVTLKGRKNYDARAKSMPAFKPGDRVYVQHPQTKRWSMKAEVIALRGEHTYELACPEGQRLTRNRRFLRECKGSPPIQEENNGPLVAGPALPRRSARLLDRQSGKAH